MAISAAAKSNHDQLFGDRVSTLAQPDPELIEYFDNFAFDEVSADAARLDETLDLHTRLMVQLAAILATGGLAEFRVVAAAAVANGGVSPVELKEIVYQSVTYVGMARAFDYLHAVNDVLTEAGVELPLPGQLTSTPQTRLEHGKAVQGRIARRRGGRSPPQRPRRTQRHHPQLNTNNGACHGVPAAGPDRGIGEPAVPGHDDVRAVGQRRPR